MSYPINYPTPQGANVQIFRASSRSTTTAFSATWVKPQGASMVWFTLIGPGGEGGDAISDASGGNAYGGAGGSGAVTNCMVPAFLVPDTLQIRVTPGIFGLTNQPTAVLYQQKAGTGYVLLEAADGGNGGNASSVGGANDAGTGGAGGAASASNGFAAAGFFQSVAGQGGAAGNVDQTTSTTTFVQGGASGAGLSSASQYGYFYAAQGIGQQGYGMISPILVGVASTQTNVTYTTAANASRNGFGCGGGGAFTTTASTRTYGGAGGDGLCVIVTW